MFAIGTCRVEMYKKPMIMQRKRKSIFAILSNPIVDYVFLLPRLDVSGAIEILKKKKF